MKRGYLILCALCVSLMTLANPIDVKTANGIAQKFIKSKAEEVNTVRGLHKTNVITDADLRLVYEPAGHNTSEYYVFAPANSAGFVIVSGEDEVSPIVGYSFTEKFSADNMPPALKNMLSSYAQHIGNVRAGIAEPAPQAKESITPVLPLISTTWNQGYPYNCLCPKIGEQQTITGCIATATAQIMKYHEWPKAGHGQCVASTKDGNVSTITLGEEYDWKNMKDNYATYTTKEAQAVGLLMRDVGHACGLQYGVDLTGGYAVFSAVALLKNFDYSPTVQLINKAYYSDAKWNELLYKELSSGRPVFYGGENDGGGHVFVCCGIDQSGGYYINWGWGGNCDGYFYLDALVSPGGDYNNWQKAIIGIKPIANNESIDDYLALPHIGQFTITEQNTALSSPSVTCSFYADNGAADIVTGAIGYAVFENGKMISPEVTQIASTQLHPNQWVQINIKIDIHDISDAPQGEREIRFFYRPDGDTEWYTPMGDQCIYAQTTAEGHKFSTEIETEQPEISAAEIANGNYYLKNVATGQYLVGGNDWGTRASAGKHGLNIAISKQTNGKYIIATQLVTEGKQYLGLVDGVLYMDAAKTEWAIGTMENGYYVLTMDDAATYLAYSGNNIVSTMKTNPATNARAQWQLLTKDDFMAEMEKASANNPVDATFFIQGANFGRNDSRNGNWTGDLSLGGENQNFCAEKWNTSAFNVGQTLTGLPNGIYELRAQGFYREGSGDNTPNIAASNYAAGKTVLNTILYANDKSVPLPSIISDAKEGAAPNVHFYSTSLGYVPQDMAGASQFFSEGLYQQSLQVEVTDGTLRIGVKKDVASVNDWTCFDNFELYYYGGTSELDMQDSQSEFSQTDDERFNSITYTRNFADTNWQALYVPFEIPLNSLSEDFEIAEINNVHQYDRNDDGVTDETIIEAFKVTDGTLEANYPYLIRAKSTGEKSIAVNDAILYATAEKSIDCSSVREKFTFTGTYKYITSDKFPQGEGYYTLIDGEWQPTTASTTLGAFRFYLKVDSRNSSATAQAGNIRMRIIGEDDEETSIVSPQQDSESTVIYDLQGRRVITPTKGIYIKGGKKYLVK